MLSKTPLICNVDLPPEERSLYYQILNNQYVKLKRTVEVYWMNKSGESFSEDVFHDTIVNCVNACCKMMSIDEIYKYVCKSYYINMLREKKYHKNIMESEIIIDAECNDESYEAFRRELYEYVSKDKGKRIADIIHDYVDGYTYDELIRKYNIKNIHKKAGPIKQYMKRLIEENLKKS